MKHFVYHHSKAAFAIAAAALLLLGACTERRTDSMPDPDNDQPVEVIIPDHNQENQ